MRPRDAAPTVLPTPPGPPAGKAHPTEMSRHRRRGGGRAERGGRQHSKMGIERHPFPRHALTSVPHALPGPPKTAERRRAILRSVLSYLPFSSTLTIGDWRPYRSAKILSKQRI